jgi:hypothetical protein
MDASSFIWIQSARCVPPHAWISRVAGDALDGVLLAAPTKTRRPGAFTGICAMVLGVAAMDVLYAQRLSRNRLFSWWPLAADRFMVESMPW